MRVRVRLLQHLARVLRTQREPFHQQVPMLHARKRAVPQLYLPFARLLPKRKWTRVKPLKRQHVVVRRLLDLQFYRVRVVRVPPKRRVPLTKPVLQQFAKW